MKNLERFFISMLFFFLVFAGSRTQARKTNNLDLSQQYLIDSIGYFDQNQKAEIINQLKEFKEKHNVSLYITIYNDNIKELSLYSKNILFTKFASSKEGKWIMVLIDLKHSQSRIMHSTYYYRGSELDNISFQYISQNLKKENTIPLTQAITLMLKELSDITAQRKAKMQEMMDIANGKLSKEVIKVIIVLGLFFIGYAIIYIVKISRPGKDYEKIRFYSLNCISPIYRYGLLIILFTSIVFFLNSYLFYYDELFWSASAVLALSMPLTNAFAFIILIPIHYFNFIYKDKQEHKLNSVSEIGIAPSKLLLNRFISGFDLFEITFYSLLIKKQISIDFEWRERRNFNSLFFHMNKGECFSTENSKSYDKLYLEPFEELKDGYGYYLNGYLPIAYNNLYGLKHFIKIYVAGELLKFKLIKPNYWLINLFFPSNLGLNLKARLKKKIKLLEKDLNLVINEPYTNISKLAHIDQDILLVDDYKTYINKIREILIDMEFEIPTEWPIALLINRDFNFDEFGKVLGSLKSNNLDYEN